MRNIKLRFVYKCSEGSDYIFRDEKLSDIIDMDAVCSYYEKDGYKHIDTVQSTELKYNNDDDIFESDIVKLLGGTVVLIVFLNGAFGYYGHFDDFIPFAAGKHIDEYIARIEKLGNKWEDAELLKIK